MIQRYRQLFRYATPHKAGWALILATTLAATAFSLAQPWPMKILVDHILGDRPLPPALARLFAVLPGVASKGGLLVWVVLAGVLIFVVNSAVDVALTLAWTRVGRQTVYGLAQDLFARTQRKSLLFHARKSVGDLLTRITGDSWSVHTIVDTLLFAPGYALVTIIGMIVVMARIDPGLTLLALTVAPLMSLSSWMAGGSIKTAALARREIESRIQSHVQQTLTGISVIQAFTREQIEHERFQRHAADAIRAHQRSALVGSAYGLATGFITTSGTAVVLWIAAKRVLEGTLTLGLTLVFLSYLRTLQHQLAAFANVYTSLKGAGAGVDRVSELLEARDEVQDPVAAAPLAGVRGHVKLENVTFGYEPPHAILTDVWLEAEPGETLAIVGQTGAGKSTLVSLIPRFIDPWAGRVLVDGHDVRDVRLKDLRAHTAIVLQEPFLFPFTIAENIAFGRPDASRTEIEGAAREALAHEFIARLPQGYDTVIGERGATLSGGERQRLSIARALLKDAPILILDEPTSALDAETEQALLAALERLMQGRTTFIIAHRLSTIRKADRIVVLHGGVIVEVGTHAELLAQGGRYRLLHDAQFAPIAPVAAAPAAPLTTTSMNR